MKNTTDQSLHSPADFQSDAFDRRLRRRRSAATRLRVYGLGAIILALGLLFFLLANIVYQGYPAFWRSEIQLEIYFDPEVIAPDGERDSQTLRGANYQRLIDAALESRFADVDGRLPERRLHDLVSDGASFQLGDRVVANPELIGSRQKIWLPASDDVDQLVKGVIPRDVPEADRKISNRQLDWIDALSADGDLQQHFNFSFFTHSDSRNPPLAGIWGALVGSFYTMLVTLLLAFPVGVAAAIYLEEFAPKNIWTEIIEVNINNLVAVPSIVFGLLGLAVFLNFFQLPRSSPLVGGMVLALMTLPIIILASRSALKAVPPSIRYGALAVGASPLQVVFYHVLPLSLPGMLTGSILGMARALGETAPLLLIGMVAFIVAIPDGFTDQATVLPVQIYIWSTSPERAFVSKTAAGIMVLLTFLILMNALAIYLRKRFEQRW